MDDAGLPPVPATPTTEPERMDAGLPPDPTYSMDGGTPGVSQDPNPSDNVERHREMEEREAIHSDPWGNALVGAVATAGIGSIAGVASGIAGAGEAAAQGAADGLTQGAAEVMGQAPTEVLASGLTEGGGLTSGEIVHHALSHAAADFLIDQGDHALSGTHEANASYETAHGAEPAPSSEPIASYEPAPTTEPNASYNPSE